MNRPLMSAWDYEYNRHEAKRKLRESEAKHKKADEVKDENRDRAL